MDRQTANVKRISVQSKAPNRHRTN